MAASPPRHSARLIALALLGVMLFNYPLLSLINGSGTLFGIPLTYVYLFGVWLLLIGLAAWFLGGRAASQLSEGKDR
jgi:hypothetical protein